VAIVVAAALPASASDTGFFLGVGLGRSTIDIKEFYSAIGQPDNDDADPGFQSQHNSAFKVYGGYRFSDFLAVEASSLDLGSPQAWETTVQEHPERAEISVDGWNAFAVGIVPVGRIVDFFAKIGMMSWDSEIISIQDEVVIHSESSSGTDLAYGLGIGFWVSGSVTVRVEGERFTIGDYDDVSLWSLGVAFTF
jgi:OOP family OmpA-OmpF porin